MATSRRHASSDKGQTTSRTERLLALILLESSGEGGQQRRAELLRKAGFQNREIADLLGTRSEVIGQVLYLAKKNKAKKLRSKKKQSK